MSLVLEVPAETEAELRALALAHGQDVATFLVESARRAVYSVDEAASEIGVARAFLKQQVEQNALSSIVMNGELFLIRDARFEALLQSQQETEAALRKIAAQSQAQGLYNG